MTFPPPECTSLSSLASQSQKTCRARHVVSVCNPSTWEVTQGYIGKSLLPTIEVKREERRKGGMGRERNVKEKEM